MDYYSYFNIPKSASLDDLKKAFRVLAKKHHPDLNPNNPEAHKKFLELQRNYEVFFEQLEKKTSQPSHKTKDKIVITTKQDIYQNLYLTLEEVCQGTQKNIKVKRQNGNQQITTTLTLTIPRGTKEKSVLSFKGEGYGPEGNRGDLYITVLYYPHPFFIQRGLHIYISIPLTLKEWLLNLKFSIPTPHGPLRFQPSNPIVIQKDYLFKQKGIPQKDHKKPYGDLIVSFIVARPDKVSNTLKEELFAIPANHYEDRLIRYKNWHSVQ